MRAQLPDSRWGDGAFSVLLLAFLVEHTGTPWSAFWLCVCAGTLVNVLQLFWLNRRG